MFLDLEIQIDSQPHKLMWPEVDKNTFGIITIDWAKYFFPIISELPQKQVVVQAGGHCGLYALLYSKQFNRVFTFEPDPLSFHCLTYNCKSNKIVKLNTALGARCSFNNIGTVVDDNTGMNKIGAGNTVVYQLTVDSLNLPQCDVIHLDIEGYEYQALNGAKQTIKKFKPTIIVELSNNEEQIYEFLNKYKYTPQEIAIKGSKNVVFRP